MLTNTHVFFTDRTQHTVDQLNDSVSIYTVGSFYPSITLHFTDGELAAKVAAVLRKACNPRHSAEERAPPLEPSRPAAAPEPLDDKFAEAIEREEPWTR